MAGFIGGVICAWRVCAMICGKKNPTSYAVVPAEQKKTIYNSTCCILRTLLTHARIEGAMFRVKN